MKFTTLFKYPIRSLGLDLLFFRLKWRRANRHNHTLPMNRFDPNSVRVGEGSYGPLEVHMWDSKSESLEIGSYVSIAAGVQFVIGGNHALNTLTTYPLKVLRWQEQSESLSKGPVAVKDDVWIGTNSIILSGVTLEQGSVVAAGSVVTKSVPPYAIVGGNPAKIIRYRFPLEVIERLLRLNFKKIMQLPRESLEPFAYSELTEQNLSQLEKKLSQ